VAGRLQEIATASGVARESLAAVSEKSVSLDDRIAEIAAASLEQKTGLAQISQSMSEIDTVTQQAAAGSEESAASANELEANSREMLGVVEELFRIVGGQREGAPVLKG